MNFFGAIFFSFVTLVAILGVRANSLECPKICPDILQETCATDGLQYVKFDNLCELSVFNCKRQRSTLSTFKSTDMDWCTTIIELDDNARIFSKDLETTYQSCLKPCPLILKPVCGSNGTYRKTFSNECEMKMFACIHKMQQKNGWRLLKNSECSKNFY